MDKIILSGTDVEFVLQWRDEHKDLVHKGVCPLRAVKLVFPDVGITTTAIRNASLLSFSVTRDGKSLGKLAYTILGDGKCALTHDTTKLPEEDKQAVLTVYCSVMALLVYGRADVNGEQKEIAPKETRELKQLRKTGSLEDHRAYGNKKKKTGYTYILTSSAQHTSAVSSGSRRKIDHAFSVRGHWRHYKSGKTIWIEQFTKGKGKHKDKNYKLGRTEQ